MNIFSSQLQQGNKNLIINPDAHESHMQYLNYHTKKAVEFKNVREYSINEIEYTVNKKQGSIFVFDSNLLHSVNTITNGLRYSINVWPSKIIKKSLICKKKRKYLLY